jgi:hypothetical protein
MGLREIFRGDRKVSNWPHRVQNIRARTASLSSERKLEVEERLADARKRYPNQDSTHQDR